MLVDRPFVLLLLVGFGFQVDVRVEFCGSALYATEDRTANGEG